MTEHATIAASATSQARQASPEAVGRRCQHDDCQAAVWMKWMGDQVDGMNRMNWTNWMMLINWDRIDGLDGKVG
jgi:hypothetical protein